jgi:hypothetical protein
MPAAGPEDSRGDASVNLSLWHRFLLRLPHLNTGQPKPRLMDRVRGAVLKPEDPDAPSRSRGAYELSGEELVTEERRTNDKERAIGLLAGPVATIIAFVVIHYRVVNDPPATLHGVPDKLHVNLSTYSDLFIVLIVLSFGITAMAMWRKRLFLGIVTALYGLSIFNLGYWGFGVPFVMVGAWYLVRTYRLHRNLRESTVGGPSATSPPGSSKRYTPPSLSKKGLPPGKPRPRRSTS